MRRSSILMWTLGSGRAIDSPSLKTKWIGSPLGRDITTSAGVTPSERFCVPSRLNV